MNIKFSHNYLKLMGFGDRCQLLQVIKLNYNDLSPVFIDYDTKYIEDGKINHYKLPNTDLILMVFRNNRNRLMTTIRRLTSEKFEYYKQSQGKTFKIILEEEQK